MKKRWSIRGGKDPSTVLVGMYIYATALGISKYVTKKTKNRIICLNYIIFDYIHGVI